MHQWLHISVSLTFENKIVYRHLTKFSAHRARQKLIFMQIFPSNHTVQSFHDFFSGCKVDVILSDKDPQVHGQEAWSMADLLQDDGSAYTDVYPSECQLDHSVF